MWYKITATYEDGTVRTYEKKGLDEAMKMVARIKVTDQVVTCKNHLLSCKMERED